MGIFFWIINFFFLLFIDDEDDETTASINLQLPTGCDQESDTELSEKSKLIFMYKDINILNLNLSSFFILITFAVKIK